MPNVRTAPREPRSTVRGDRQRAAGWGCGTSAANRDPGRRARTPMCSTPAGPGSRTWRQRRAGTYASGNKLARRELRVCFEETLTADARRAAAGNAQRFPQTTPSMDDEPDGFPSLWSGCPVDDGEEERPAERGQARRGFNDDNERRRGHGARGDHPALVVGGAPGRGGAAGVRTREFRSAQAACPGRERHLSEPDRQPMRILLRPAAFHRVCDCRRPAARYKRAAGRREPARPHCPDAHLSRAHDPGASRWFAWRFPRSSPGVTAPQVRAAHVETATYGTPVARRRSDAHREG